MIRHLIVSALVLLGCLNGLAAQAQPKIKVINFTAEWCGVCKVMDPRIDAALAILNDPDIAHYPVDLSPSTSRQDSDRIFFWAKFRPSLQARGIGAVHDGYMGYPYTGYSIILAADTHEPLACIMAPMSTDEVIGVFRQSLARYDQYPAYRRASSGTNCPSSFRYLSFPTR